MKFFIIGAIALPVGFVAYLKATKQTVQLDNGVPKLVKVNALKAKEGIKAAANVAELAGGSKLKLATEAVKAIAGKK